MIITCCALWEITVWKKRQTSTGGLQCGTTGVGSVWADGAVGRQGRLSEKHSKEQEYLSFVEKAK